jgi:adenylate cyclase
MRIGIFTGPAVVGAYGSRERLKYASTGDTVNTAARLEAFDKTAFELDPEHSLSRILVGESTWRHLDDRFRTECLGSHVLRGKGKRTTIYRVLGPADADQDDRGEVRTQ